MLTAQYLGPGQIEVVDIAIPEIGADEALIEVEACGFCGTDLSIVAGTHPRARAPLTLGHEICGRIAEIDTTVSEIAVGDRVSVYPLFVCGECHACTHGNAHVCRKLRLFGIDVDGGMAQYVRLPVSALVKLPATMPAKIGALIEPLAVTVHGVNQVNLHEVELAVVMGAGPIGLMTALVAKAREVPHVIISDVLPARRELATKLGLQAVSAGDDLAEMVMESTHGNGADLIFECAGAPASAIAMTALVRSRGVIVNLGVFKKPTEVDLQAINFKEIQLLGSRVYRHEDFDTAINLASHLPLEPIVTHAFPLQNVSHAFEQFKTGAVCKALILPNQDQHEPSSPSSRAK